MDASRTGNQTSAHAAAAIASVFVVVAGAGVGAYLIRFRAHPAGVPVPAAELTILGGGLVAVAAATYFAVASACRHAAAGLRQLLGHALELDATDPQAAAAFEAEPQLRDLVNMWIGEKTQARELGDRMETMRGEIDGLIAGMSRSAQDLTRLRTETLSPVGVQLAGVWNVMLERARHVEAPAEATAAASASPAVHAAPEVRALVDRLDELESELERLRTHVQDPVLEVVPESAPLDKVPMLLPDTEEDIREDLLFTPSVQAEPEWGDVHVVEPRGNAQPWQLEDEPFGAPQATAPVDAVAPPSRVTDREPAPPQIRRGEVVAVVPGAGRPQPARIPASALAERGAMQFEDLDFPHFVGRPVGDADDRVAVTYDAQTAAESGELPASALLFDDEPAAPEFESSPFQPPERSR